MQKFKVKGRPPAWGTYCQYLVGAAAGPVNIISLPHLQPTMSSN